MERLRGTTMNQRVHKAMEYWLEAIKFVQECRKREVANATKRQKENPPCILVYNDNGTFIAQFFKKYNFFLNLFYIN